MLIPFFIFVVYALRICKYCDNDYTMLCPAKLKISIAQNSNIHLIWRSAEDYLLKSRYFSARLKMRYGI